MRRTFVISVMILLFAISGFAQEKLTKSEKQHILSLLDKQAEAWKEGNLEKFMETYWKSNKLVFMGSRGPTYGWQATLDSYKKGYPDKKAMGHLEFKVLDINKIDTKTVFLIGRFELTREIGDLAGHFTLVIQKIDGKWVIVSDHSSGES
ncbi:nuclear transport factor 2 family protein [uncultured Draconibacterium sp.]|uniref:YybH family protein n=1 Tax=uncultured Draconibacterium sp. TaxID=1573823 RepID=UPI0029C7CFDA|nr:nuclear transport factor 2 family protein [uncultured Draconibacterium sp.]